jgi:hypothetical protein
MGRCDREMISFCEEQKAWKQAFLENELIERNLET